jgi:2,5-diketo-D-gluconate reductase B
MSPYFQRNYARSFGTYPLQGDVLKSSIKTAIEVGYRAFDTAQMYGNEADVGDALKASGIDRNELFITTKVHPDNFDEGKFIPSVKESLMKLRVDHVDSLLLHWPPIEVGIAQSLQHLEEAAKQGLSRHIGVSNYTAQMMREARTVISTPLITNQVEFHPLLDQSILLKAAVDTGIALSSYCSVARGEVFKYPLFNEIGKYYDKSPAQVVLRWILQRGVSINTMSTKPDNIQANYDVMDFTLSASDMARIDALNQTGYRIVDASLVPWAPVWDK